MYQIGDRVRLLVEYPACNYDLAFGETGTICHIDWIGNSCYMIGVRWDKEIAGGHNCDGFCEVGYGWFVVSEDIELLNKVPELQPIPEADFLEMLD